MEEALSVVTIDDWDEGDADRLLAALESLGTVERPLADRPLFRMDEPAFVVSGSLESGRFRLRSKTTADVDHEAVLGELERAVECEFRPSQER